MKGVLLAGGTGSRLAPLTSVVNKHLLPVYNKPMVLYPLETLKRAGVTDIMLVTGGEHLGRFIEFLGDGSKFGVTLTYQVQEQAGGIGQALGLCEEFAAGEQVSVILGDNVLGDDFMPKASRFGCTVFLKEVSKEEAQRFGCAVVEGEKVVSVEEKPKSPKSTLALTGYYMFPSDVFSVIKGLKPSARGELEITDVINVYVQRGECGFSAVESYWSDAGTFDSLLAVSNFMYEKNKAL
jgi:glucose-1-phosphate thymidylyltransferase